MAKKIDTWMIFEVLASRKGVAEKSLKEHVEKIEKEKSVDSLEKEFDEIKEVEDPHPSIKKGFSQICEIRCKVESFSELVKIVLNYGPTMIEIEGPEKIEMDMGEMQDSLNLVAEMMHKFLKAGAGGMMISGKE